MIRRRTGMGQTRRGLVPDSRFCRACSASVRRRVRAAPSRAGKQERTDALRDVQLRDPDDVAAWEASTREEQAADVQRHREWFGKWRDHIAGGEELDYPRTVKTLRPGRQGEGISVTDGPYVETKELLGGFVILEAADMDEAIAIASEWPSLATQPNATVQLQPIYPPRLRSWHAGCI